MWTTEIHKNNRYTWHNLPQFSGVNKFCEKFRFDVEFALNVDSNAPLGAEVSRTHSKHHLTVTFLCLSQQSHCFCLGRMNLSVLWFHN